MRYVTRLLLLLVFGTITSLVFAQSDSPFIFEGDGTTPAIEHLAPGRGSEVRREQYTDPGAVVFHDGQFHMFRNAFVGWPAAVWIHYMVSDDGVTWEQPLEEPILLTDDVPFADVAALASSVIVEEDGTWVLYFYTWNTSSLPSEGEIGRATASSPLGPWVVAEAPVLTFGEDDTFDEGGVASPHVVRTDDGYLMYYDAFTEEFAHRSIGLATSDDGVIWEKAADNPIFAPELDWEGVMTHQARVMPYQDGYLMIYRAAILGQGGMRLGIATSDDGIEWQRASEPILAPDDLPEHRAFWFTQSVLQDDLVSLFIELTPITNTTDIYTMTASLDDLLERFDS